MPVFSYVNFGKQARHQKANGRFVGVATADKRYLFLHFLRFDAACMQIIVRFFKQIFQNSKRCGIIVHCGKSEMVCLQLNSLIL